MRYIGDASQTYRGVDAHVLGGSVKRYVLLTAVQLSDSDYTKSVNSSHVSCRLCLTYDVCLSTGRYLAPKGAGACLSIMPYRPTSRVN